MAQILTNSRMCAQGHRPVCQDTGIVVAFVRVGMEVRWEGASMSVTEMVNAGVRKAYLHPDNVLRASIVADPAGKRKNTGDNTPAVVHFELVPGDKVEVRIAAKGGGSENKARFAMLNPGDDVVEWVLSQLPGMGAGWCPPGMLGIGIGGTAEKAMLLAKEALMQPIDMPELKARGAQNRTGRIAHRDIRQGECAGHRRAGPGRTDHGAGCEDTGLPDPCGFQAGGDDPQLRGDAAYPFRAGWQAGWRNSRRPSWKIIPMCTGNPQRMRGG